MKKVLAIVLVLVLVMASVSTAFAETTTSAIKTIDVSGTVDSKPVKVTIDTKDGSADVYHVDIEWESLVFDYDQGSVGTWNSETHGYDGAIGGHWETSDFDRAITVTNHSNKSVYVSSKFENSDTVEDTLWTSTNEVKITLTKLENHELTAGSLVSSGTCNCKHADLVLTLVDTTRPTSDSEITVDTVNITISKSSL